jgi:hypothetical protein
VPTFWVPRVTQTPVRHCSEAVHVPPPGPNPQLPSAPQTPLTQRSAASIEEHEPPGIGCPFGVRGTQLDVLPLKLHQLPELQSLSCWQVALQLPKVRLPTVRLQKGNVPPQSLAVPAPWLPVQAAHASFVQTGDWPMQFEASLIVHCTH